MGRIWPWRILALATFILVGTVLVVDPLLTGTGPLLPSSPFPPCRKSPDMHALSVPGADGQTHETLVALGGKGYVWEVKHGNEGLISRDRPKKVVQILGDTWAFNLENASWEMPEMSGATGPGRRWKTSGTEFDGGRRLVIFGGCRTTNVNGVLADLWVFEPSCCPSRGLWRPVATRNPPLRRRGHLVVANSTHLAVYGGKTVHGVCLTDLWLLPLSALRGGGGPPATWVKGGEFPGGCFWGATGTLLKTPDRREYLGAFGGRVLNTPGKFHSTAAGAYTYFHNIWLYDFAKGSWSMASPEGPIPHTRDHHGAANIHGDLYVFGGRLSETRAASAVVNDVWSYSLGTNRWTQHYASSRAVGGAAPLPRFMPGVSKVRWHGRELLAVFGGETLPGSSKRTTLNDVWTFDPSPGGGWQLISSAACSSAATGFSTEPHEQFSIEEVEEDEANELAEEQTGVAGSAKRVGTWGRPWERLAWLRPAATRALVVLCSALLLVLGLSACGAAQRGDEEPAFHLLS